MAFLLTSFSWTAFGFESAPALSQYGHTAWRVQDGVFKGTPSALAQTADGYLWIGTASSLVRFDGAKFVAFPGEPLSVTSLVAGRDGTLWVGTTSGLVSIKDGQLHRYENAKGFINTVVAYGDGSIWFTRSRFAKGAGPLCKVVNAVVKCFGSEDGLVSNQAGALAVDRDRNLWIGLTSTLLRWKAGISIPFIPDGVKSRPMESAAALQAILPRDDGSVLLGLSIKGPGLGLQSLQGGKWSPAVIPGFDSEKLGVTDLIEERDHSLWIGTDGEGVLHVHGQKSDRFSEADGMSGNVVTSLLQDAEGNLWITTTKGLDCFRKLRMLSYSQREGLSSDFVASVVPLKDGQMLIGNRGGLTLLRDGTPSTIQAEEGLPGARVTSMLEQASGRVWVGVDMEVFTFSNGHFDKIDRNSPKTAGSVVAITEDTDHNVWVLRAGRPYNLYRFDPGSRMLVDMPIPSSEGVRTIAADPGGGLLIGTDERQVASFRGGVWKTLMSKLNGRVSSFVTYPDGSFWGVTSLGLVSWKGNQEHLLDGKHGLPCDEIYSAVLDDSENLWAYASCGLMKISKDELRRWWRNPDASVVTRLFDVFDGVLASGTPFSPAAVRSPNGSLWFANGHVLQTINPSALASPGVQLPVRIEEFVADHQPVAVTGVPDLPALTRSFEFRYTALSPASAKKMQFRYRLDGFDADWQYAGKRREAFYNDLSPGHYRFRVSALDNDEVWTPEGAVLDFVVLPAWYQTTLFRITAIAMLGLAIWLLYSARIRQIQRDAAGRYNERMQERTRLARDLHDTLLQTIQASKIIADGLLDEPEAYGARRKSVQNISDWLGQAVEEGRAALQSLRISGDESSDLAVALGNALARSKDGGSMQTSLMTEGQAWAMDPIIHDEVYRIGVEALKNASAHSHASHLVLTLVYKEDLVLSIVDDGIGIDPAMVEKGRSKHFGITGMQERAARIGASLNFSSAPGGGTQVVLVLPRAKSTMGHQGIWPRIRNIFKSGRDRPIASDSPNDPS